MRGPFGNGFDLGALRRRPLVLVAGGMGLAPLRSLVRYIDSIRREFGPVAVLYGARTPEDRLYKDEIEQWRRTPGTTVQEIVEKDPNGRWPGRLGRVADLFSGLGGEFAGAAAVLCGPHSMIGPVVHALERLGIHDRNMQVTLEGRMNCGTGKCGHCYVGDKLVCADGPVFTAERLRSMDML
jgi:NAD(P)H-flavin reductase